MMFPPYKLEVELHQLIVPSVLQVLDRHSSIWKLYESYLCCIVEEVLYNELIEVIE